MSYVGNRSKKERFDDYSSGFLRQRRNLIVACLILVFYKYGNVSIDKASTGFLLLTIGNKEAVVHFLWAIWGYFLLRYFQYERRENDTESRFLWNLRYAISTGVNKYNGHRVDLLNKNNHALDVLSRLGPPTYQLPFYRRKYEAIFLKKSLKNPHTPPKKYTRTFEYNIFKLVPTVAWFLMRDINNYFWRSSTFTDYYFPYAFALIAFSYQVYY